MPNFKINENTKSQIWLFKTADWGKQFFNYIQLKYPSVEITTFKLEKNDLEFNAYYKKDDIKHYLETQCIYVVVTTLPFSMKWSTWKEKFCKAIEKSRLYAIYAFNLISRLPSIKDLDDNDLVKELLICILTTCLEVEEFGIDIDVEIVKEMERTNFNSRHNDEPNAKKRKICTF